MFILSRCTQQYDIAVWLVTPKSKCLFWVRPLLLNRILCDSSKKKKKKKKNTLCLIRDSQHSSQILQSNSSNHLRSQVSHLKNFITLHNLNLCSTRLLSFSNLRSISESLVEFYRRYYYHCYSWIYFRTFTAQIYTRAQGFIEEEQQTKRGSGFCFD